MADYNINAVTRKVYYTGSAGVGPYSFSFEILLETDIAVYFNETLLTLTTDYTVTINANGTGSITIVTGTNVPTTPDADDRITILGAKDIERTTDFATAGAIRAASFNEQLDALTIFDQQISERIDRSIKAPAFDPVAIDMTLPGFLDRANKFLTFDSEGDVSTSALTGLSELIIDNVKIDGNTISSLSGGIIINPYSSEDAEIYDAYLRGSQITVQAPFKDVAGNTMMSLGTTRQALYYSNTTAMRTEEGGAELFGSDNTFGGRIILTSTVAQDAIVDDDIAGSVVFQGYYPKPSGVTSDFVYSTIESEVTDATNGSVNSQLNFKVAAQNTANAVTLSLFGGSTSANGPSLTFNGGNLSSDPAGTGGLFVIQPSLGKISFAGNPSLTFGGDTLTQGSINSEGDFFPSTTGQLNLTNEYDSNKSTPIPLVQLYRDNASPAAADKLGKLSFRANDSLGNKTEYANIAVDLDDPTNGSEDGSLRFEVMQGGSVSTAMEIDAAGVTIPGNLTVQGTTITIDSASAQTVDLGDNDKIRLGDGDDLQIYHDGTDSYISNSTGGLKLSGSVEVDDTDNLRLRFLNSGTFKGGVEVATTAGDMISTSAVDDLAIRSQSDIRFSTGGNTERVHITSSGTGSVVRLTGAGPLTADDIIGRIEFYSLDGSGEGANNSAIIEARSVSAAGEDAYLSFKTVAATSEGADATESMRIDSSGNVGIGTSSPSSAKLHVVGNNVLISDPVQSNDSILLTPSSTNNDVPSISFTNTGTQTFALEHRGASAPGDKNTTRFIGATGTDFRWLLGGSEAMRIDSSGNVGIGTSSPSSANAVNRVVNVDAPSGQKSGISLSEAGANFFDVFFDGSSNSAHLYNSASGGMLFYSSGSEAMRIDSSGNVGIGTTSPSATLSLDKNTGGQHRALDLENNNITYSMYLDQDGVTSNSWSIFDTTNSQTAIRYYPGGSGLWQFYTNNSERMRIDSSGHHLYDRTTTIASNITCQIRAKTSGGIAIEDYTGTGWFQRFYNSALTQVGSISRAGTSTNYTTTSDYRLKENVVDMTGAVDRVKALNPSQFNFIADPDRTVDGFLAHEVADVVPEAITGTKDEVDDNGNPEYQGIDQSKLVPLLTGALQEAIARIETLEAQVATLQGN